MSAGLRDHEVRRGRSGGTRGRESYETAGDLTRPDESDLVYLLVRSDVEPLGPVRVT